MALPEELRNKVYDYVITGDTQDGWGLSENCGNGFVDCSRGVISQDVGDRADFAHLDDVGSYEYSFEMPTNCRSSDSDLAPRSTLWRAFVSFVVLSHFLRFAIDLL